MPYRQQAPDWVGARVAQIAAEVNDLDQSIAEWSRRLPSGVPAPPELLSLYERKNALVTELLALHARFHR